MPEAAGFPDNWIYIHAPDVEVDARAELPELVAQMVPESGKTCLGLEYFVTEGDELWTSSDDDLVALGAEWSGSGCSSPGSWNRVRGSDAEGLPMYDASYHDNVDVLRGWLARTSQCPPVEPQRHASLQQSGPLDVHGDAHRREHRRRHLHDVWEVNVEASTTEVAEEGPRSS